MLLCWYLKDYHGQLTPEFCGPQQWYKLIFYNKFYRYFLTYFFLKVCIIFWVKFLYLGCYQANEISIIKITEAASEEGFRFTHGFMQLRGTWNALTCSYKSINNVLIFETFENWCLKLYKKWRYFKCELKIASRQRCDNKWVIAIEPNHLNSWSIHSGTNHSHVTQRRKTVLWLCLELFFVGEIEQKQEIWLLKHKFHNITFLFIKLLHEINIISIMLTSIMLRKKRLSSCAIN